MNNNDGMWRDHRDELLDRVVKRGSARKRRRGLAVSATLLALMLVLGAGLYLPGRNTHTLHVAKNPHDAATVPPTQSTSVLLIGDSLMQLAKPVLKKVIPDAHVNTAAARQFGDADAILAAVKARGPLPATIVIHLGDNGPSEGDVFDKTTTEFRAIMDTVGPDSEVYFLSLKLPRQWEAMLNSALYSEVAVFPNAHVLAWHDFSRTHDDWFLNDGFHLTPAGQAAYAGFIRQGIRAPVTTYNDPFAGRAVPTSGFAVTDDAKPDPQGLTSFAMEVFDNAGHDLGSLPRTAVDTGVQNAYQHVLVVEDSGIHFESAPLDAPADLPGGCIATEKDDALAVALCGSGVGMNLLGNRILVNHGTGWKQIIGLPPIPAGSDFAGHWAWASPSPDGRWVAGSWSAECEVPIGFLVSVADGSVHTVTGEVGEAWRNAPTSGIVGWQADGSAMGIFGGETDCGTPAPSQRGIYLVSPDTGARRLFVPLTPSQGILTWSAVRDERSTPVSAGDNLSIVHAYQHFFDPAVSPNERAALVQGSAAMRAFMDQAFARHASEVAGGSIVVDKVAVHGTTADVTFHALLYGRPSPANPGQITGTAVLEDGTWKVSRATYCTLSANDGEVCPPA